MRSATTPQALGRLLVRRVVAGLVDGLLAGIPSGVLVAINILDEPEGFEGLGAIFLAVGLLLAVPPAGAAVFANRQSPGRHLARLAVVKSSGEPVSPMTAAVRVLVPVLVAAGPYGLWVVFGGAVLSIAWKKATWWELLTRTRVVPVEAHAVPTAPPRLRSGLRVGLGWLVAVLWIVTAALIGFAGGVSGGFLLLSPVVAALLWWTWPRPRRWLAPLLFLVVVLLAISPGIVDSAP